MSDKIDLSHLISIPDDLLSEADWTYGNRSSGAVKRRRAYLFAKSISVWIRAAVMNTRNPQTGEISPRKVADFLNDFQPEGYPIKTFDGGDFHPNTVSRLLYETESRNTAWVEFEFEREVSRLGDKLTVTGRAELEGKRDEMIQEGVELARFMRMDDQPVRKPDRRSPF